VYAQNGQALGVIIVALSLREIESRVSNVRLNAAKPRDFIFELLAAYGRSPANLKRLASTESNTLNVASDINSEVAQKNLVYYKFTSKATEADLLGLVEDLSSSKVAKEYATRFIVVTDFELVLAKDQKTAETRVFTAAEIGDHFAFFLPWAGMEKAQFTSEAHADVRAAEKMAKLFDELVQSNKELTQQSDGLHSLNIFFTRLLFCFFAEDTGIFSPNQFTNAIASYTKSDGEDMHSFLSDLFKMLDSENRENKAGYLNDFPYVNGQLFSSKKNFTVPVFNRKARDLLLDSGKLQWSEINPDIFGSMFQAVVNPDQRLDLGQHYTSVPNILKTIEPLFLNELHDSFQKSFDSERNLELLLTRISQIKIFDPACGSGNFLIIAYKELRKLEHKILERLAEMRGYHQDQFGSTISIEHFYGIEIDDFAVEVAILSLWIAKHQMNIEFKEKFGTDLPLIPLKEMGHIRHGNATRIDWNSVCRNDGVSEIYLIGNPPYKGGKSQSAEMKSDYPHVFRGRAHNKDLDYIALWFIKGADYIRQTKAELAFVTTNSVAQGDHVGLMFPMLFAMGLEIGYAYSSFKWENNAKRNAGVTVAVINLRNKSTRQKYLFVDGLKISVKNINGYLADGPNISVSRRSTVMSELPPMSFGSMPRDAGWLSLDLSERNQILDAYPEAEALIKRYAGSVEFINGLERFCLWISEDQLTLAESIPPIRERLERVKEFRLNSDAKSTVAYAEKPYRFVQIAYKATDSIIVPRVSSERREYIPIGYLGSDTVISDAANAVYDAEPWVFALLTSRMHMAWTRAVGGRLKTDYRYSNTIVYNNLTIPLLSREDKDLLSASARRILKVREFHSECTLAELYDPDLMPENLRLAHLENDRLVENFYRSKPFISDEDRLSHLFSRYVKANNLENVLDGQLFGDF
jgi:hypothetical protein